MFLGIYWSVMLFVFCQFVKIQEFSHNVKRLIVSTTVCLLILRQIRVCSVSLKPMKGKWIYLAEIITILSRCAEVPAYSGQVKGLNNYDLMCDINFALYRLNRLKKLKRICRNLYTPEWFFLKKMLIHCWKCLLLPVALLWVYIRLFR